MKKPEPCCMLLSILNTAGLHFEKILSDESKVLLLDLGMEDLEIVLLMDFFGFGISCFGLLISDVLTGVEAVCVFTLHFSSFA